MTTPLIRPELVQPAVGKDITCPRRIANDGKIRIRSQRALEVARMFGLGRAEKPRADRDLAISIPALKLVSGTITLITGPSGSGKSSLLNALPAQRDASRPWIDLNEIELRDVPLVDCFGETSVQEVVRLLAQVGLSEAWTYLRTPGELSEGQRMRFKPALALHSASEFVEQRLSPIIVADELVTIYLMNHVDQFIVRAYGLGTVPIQSR